jgi:RNA-directed DNA polymerase
MATGPQLGRHNGRAIQDGALLFAQFFAPIELFNAFNERFSQSRSKGVDRLSGRQYSSRAEVDLAIVSKKCNLGTFRFSPYLENLRPRGRTRAPRLISIPTIRDRVVLHQLNKYLATVFPDCVPRNIASAYVREVAANLATMPPATTFVCGCDIKSFYDSLQRNRVKSLVEKRINFAPAISLISHAMSTPTVPKSAKRTTHKAFRTGRGVPQGLAISNILAAISLQEVDFAMSNLGVRYFRYVDDILMYGDEPSVRRAHKSLGARLRRRGLSLHKIGAGKSHLGPLTTSFGYLGYLFEHPKVTVRDVTVERLLQSLAAKFSDYAHNTEDRLNQSPGLSREQLRQAFILELNERITGSVSRNRKYGWIAYFNQVTDLSLLHQLDSAVGGMFGRLSDFEGGRPRNLKRFSRAYFEMKFRPTDGYIQNYDQIVTIEQMRRFLVQRGQLSPDEDLADVSVALRYDSYRRYILQSMQADEGASYG